MLSPIGLQSVAIRRLFLSPLMLVLLAFALQQSPVAAQETGKPDAATATWCISNSRVAMPKARR